jgi:hypothetical protein
MGRSRLGFATAAIAVATSCLVVVPIWALPASAHGSPVSGTAHQKKAPRHCHRTHKSWCSGTQATQKVTETSGNLTVTFTATQDGSTVDFDVSSSDTQAYGALGPELLSYGNGASQGFPTPEYCLAHPVAESSDRQISYTYGNAGTYSASVTVGANCTPDQLTLTLPITIG